MQKAREHAEGRVHPGTPAVRVVSPYHGWHSGLPRTLRERSPDDLRTLWRSWRGVRGALADLEQAWRAYAQVGERRWRQEKDEPLPLRCLDLDLVDLLIDGQYRRSYYPLRWLTQRNLVGHECPDAQDDDGAMRILRIGGRGGGAHGQPAQGHMHHETAHHDTQSATYGMHRVSSCLSHMRVDRSRDPQHKL